MKLRVTVHVQEQLQQVNPFLLFLSTNVVLSFSFLFFSTSDQIDSSAWHLCRRFLFSLSRFHRTKNNMCRNEFADRLCSVFFSFDRVRTTTQVIWTDQPHWKSIIRSHSTRFPSRDNSAMLKTTSLTKTLFNHQTHSQPINLYTPSNTSSSGSVCETDPSSTSSSYKNQLSTNGTSHQDETNVSQQEGSTLVLISMVEKLKRELSTIKQAKCQLESLYKVSRRRAGSFSLLFIRSASSSFVCQHR